MDRARIERLYHEMLLIRRAEEALQKMFADGAIPGFLHLSIGQEAVPAGVSSALRPSDTVSSNHRGHGHTLAKGVSLDAFFAEVAGKVTGICRGRGGSMHVADLSIGMLGANGIVGAGLPITTGSALALKMKGAGDIGVVYFGDGALAEGVAHECMNIAALWKLPLLFVCENNGWSEFSPTERQMATTLEKMAAAFAIPHIAVDGNDVVAVADAAAGIVASMRKTPSPHVLECHTTRVRGHFEGDKQDYRNPDELSALGERDPLKKCRAALTELGAKKAWFDAKSQEIDGLIRAAMDAAAEAPEPELDEITRDVYAQPGAMH